MHLIFIVEDDHKWFARIQKRISAFFPAHLYCLEHSNNLESAIARIDAIDRSAPCLLILDNYIPTSRIAHAQVEVLSTEKSLLSKKFLESKEESRSTVLEEICAVEELILHELCTNGSERILAHIGPLPPHWRVVIQSACSYHKSQNDDPKIMRTDKWDFLINIETVVGRFVEIAT